MIHLIIKKNGSRLSVLHMKERKKENAKKKKHIDKKIRGVNTLGKICSHRSILILF